MPIKSYTYRFSIVDKLTAPAGKITGALSKIEDRADRVSTTLGSLPNRLLKPVNGLMKRIGPLGTAIGGAFAVGTISRFANEVTSTLADFERYEAVLKNTLGSGSEAKKVLREITDFAASTPFQVDQLTDSYVRLANQGFKPNRKELMSLSDLASSTGKDFDQLTEAIIDAQVGEFERLKEFGIRASKSGDQVTFSFKGQQKQVAFNEKAIRSYLLSLGELNGVQGASAAIMETTGGKTSNLQDKLTRLKLTIGQQLAPQIKGLIDFSGRLIDRLTNTVKWISLNRVQVIAWAKVLGGVSAALFGIYGAARLILGINSAIQAVAMSYKLLAGVLNIAKIAQIGFNIAASLNPIGLIVIGIGAAVTAIVLLARRFDGFKNFLVGLGKFLWKNHPFTWMIDLVDRIFPGVKDSLNKLLKGILSAFRKAFEWLNKNIFKPFSKLLSKLFGFKSLGSIPGGIDLNLNTDGPDDDNKPNDSSGGFGSSGGGNSKTKGLGISSGLTQIAGASRNIKNINITIENLVREFIIKTENIGDSEEMIRSKIVSILLSSMNDVNLQ